MSNHDFVEGVFKNFTSIKNNAVLKIFEMFLPWVLDNINSNENVREWVYSTGKLVRNFIPGDKIEPEVNEFIKLFQAGLLGQELPE